MPTDSSNFSSSGAALRAAGSLAATRQRWDQAIRMWSAAEAAADGGPSCYDLALAALQKLKRDPDVVAACAVIRKALPRDPIGWRLEAALASAQRDWVRAAELWQACISQGPGDPAIGWYGELVTALNHLHRSEDAATACAQIRERWPNDPQGWLLEGRIAVASEDWDKAAMLLRETVQRTSGADEAYRRAELAVALTRAGAIEEASTEFSLANDIAQRHRNPRAMAAAARALQSAGRTDEALALSRLIQQKFPDDSMGWVVAGGLASALGRWRQAARLLDRALLLRGAEADIELNDRSATAFIRAGRFADAAVAVGRLKALQPQGPRWLANSIALLMGQGDARAALDELKRHQKLTGFLTAFTTDDLAQVAFEAGLSRPEALETVSGWVGAEVAQHTIAALYDVPTATSEEALKIAARDPKPVGFTSFKTWRQSARGLLSAFLRDRRSENFDAFAEVAIQYATSRELAAIQSVARARFPMSRMRIAIDQMVDPRTQPANSAEQQFVSRWRNQQPATEASIASQLAGRPYRRLVCVVPARDEEEMLPVFFAHYRALGVESFIIINNGSIRSPLEVLGPLEDVEVTIVDAPYSFGGAHHGVGWLNEILDAGLCDWMLLADADEMLIYPGSAEKPLSALLDHLESRGEDAFVATMIDVYDRSFVQTGVPSPKLCEHRLFYADHETRRSLESPYSEVTGGIRKRPHLRKAPLIRAAAGLRRTSNHSVTASRPGETTGALIHYKIYRDREFLSLSDGELPTHPRLRDRSTYEIARHVRHRVLERAPDDPFHAQVSSERLLRLGYMTADPVWRRALGAPLPENRSVAGHQVGRGLSILSEQLATGRDFAFQPTFQQIVEGVRQLVSEGQHARASALLNFQLRRLGPASLAVAVLLYAAVLTRQAPRAESLLASLRRQMAGEATDVSVASLARIAKALAELDPKIASALIELAATLLRASPPALANIIHVYALSGHSRSIFTLLPIEAPKLADPAFTRFMEVLIARREWNRFYESLEATLAGAWGGADRLLLDLVNQYPHAAARQVFLTQMADRLAEEASSLVDTGASFYLAVLHLLGRRADFEKNHAILSARLPAADGLYFERLISLQRNAKPMNQAWGLGLSRTGTTSLHRFMLEQGSLSAHWTNPVLRDLLNRSDLDVFDIVDDTPVVWLCREGGLPPGRRAIATTRDYDSWSRSIARHYANAFASEAGGDFDVLKATFESGADFRFGQAFRDIHEEIYFRFSSLREAYDYHRDWIATLASSSTVLELPLEAENKGELVSEFLQLARPAGGFPHVNRTRY